MSKTWYILQNNERVSTYNSNAEDNSGKRNTLYKGTVVYSLDRDTLGKDWITVHPLIYSNCTLHAKKSSLGYLSDTDKDWLLAVPSDDERYKLYTCKDRWNERMLMNVDQRVKVTLVKDEEAVDGIIRSVENLNDHRGRWINIGTTGVRKFLHVTCIPHIIISLYSVYIYGYHLCDCNSNL